MGLRGAVGTRGACLLLVPTGVMIESKRTRICVCLLYTFLEKTIMDEAIQALMKYFGKNENATVHYYSSGNGVKRFAEVFSENILRDERPENQRDSPDLYVKKDNLVYIIEHFEFDCFRSTKKGSKFRTEEARIERDFQRIEPTNEGTISRDVIDAESSYISYVKNVTDLFNKHSRHIPEYIDHLKDCGIIQKGDTIKVGFLIEDVSPLGTTAYDRGEGYSGNMVTITLAASIEFLELMEADTSVDFVLACSKVDSYDYIWFIDREEIVEYKANTENYADMVFLNWKPNVVCGKIAIPQEAVTNE